MGIFNKKLTKEINFLCIDKIDVNSIQSVIDFCVKQKREIIISRMIIEMSSNNPSFIKLGINMGGSVVDYDVKCNKYYYFRGNELKSVENIDDVKWW